MRTKHVLALIAFVGVVGMQTPQVEAQKVLRIGALIVYQPSVQALQGFVQMMVELGYMEGRNVRYETYDVGDDHAPINGLAHKLAGSKLDLIVTSSTSATAAVVKAAQKTGVPVVFLGAGDPSRLALATAVHARISPASPHPPSI